MFGAKTYKLKFGHRGINQPVKFEGKVYITISEPRVCSGSDECAGRRPRITTVNLNDGTVEGMRHRELPIFSVQFHPKLIRTAGHGFLFDRFAKMLEGNEMPDEPI